MPIRNPPATRDGAPYGKQVALVLQGGGALGAYQAGVYEALHTEGYEPDWIAGISIGAINSAIIAGNAPDGRVEQLRSFWREITREIPRPAWLEGPMVREWSRRMGAMFALMAGQPGFFRPVGAALAQSLGTAWGLPVGEPGGAQTAFSFYDTSDLRRTLERHVDFDRINAREIRFSVGAVNVRTGNFAYFDNREIAIGPEHVMASGALPPGFPCVEIAGERYWDGGLVSNTPLQYLLEYMPRYSTLAFQVDLFSSAGPPPRDLETVLERHKDIQYSSRTRAATDAFRYAHNLRRQIARLLPHLPEELRGSPEAEALGRAACLTSMDIVELVYRPLAAQGNSKDYEFSRWTMEERWQQGQEDAHRTLAAAPWLDPAPPEIGVRTFEVPGDRAGGEAGRHVTGGSPATLFPAHDSAGGSMALPRPVRAA